MDIYQKKARWKLYLGISGIFIVVVSMVYTKYLTDKLAEEEVKKVEQLKTAYDQLSYALEDTDSQCDFTFQSNFFESNSSVPILLVGPDGYMEGKNYGPQKDTSQTFLKKKLEELIASGQQPKVISSPAGEILLYFEHSRILKLLTYYPFIQLILVGAFILFGYLAFSAARRAEQNRVWVGMAKETAHQLGTPISGILAWMEHLRMMSEGNESIRMVVDEMEKDVKRLELISDRFSKIGSSPELVEVNIVEELAKCKAYMEPRAPRKVHMHFPDPETLDIRACVNPPLFEWVIENLLRNSLDAMDGSGEITVAVREDDKHVYVEITDTGKGIPSSKFKTIFQPGYTTKKRGWGLGLSLTKRIIESYHDGRIYVKHSTPGVATTFTIELPRNNGGCKNKKRD